jgi:hypothetical protein
LLLLLLLIPDLGDFGTEITQTGDETEPKGPPKLAKKRRSEVEGRPKIGHRAIFFVYKTNAHLIFCFLLIIVFAKMKPMCRKVAPKTKHKRQDAVANERFKKNM